MVGTVPLALGIVDRPSESPMHLIVRRGTTWEIFEQTERAIPLTPPT